MAGGTHAFDMIKRMQQNEKIRKLPYFKRKHGYPAVENNLGVRWNAPSPQEEELLQRELLQRNFWEARLKLFTLLGLAALAVIVGTLIVIFA